MIINFSKVFLCAVLLAGASFVLPAGAADSLPDGSELAKEVYGALHDKSLHNAMSKRVGRVAAMVVSRVPLEKRKRRRPHIQTFDTFINNAPADPEIDTQQMAILTSGKAKGTGVMVTRYTDPQRSAVLTIWLPALRKARHVNEPSYEDVWFGTNLTYGELVLRKPEDETHEVLGEATFDACLPSMVFESWEKNRYTQLLPGEQCGHQGTSVWRLKSTTKFVNWWYDYHITEIDKQTFWPYRTVYFKNGKKIKTVVVDWQSLDQPNPRLGYPRYIYAISHDDGRDSMVYVPRKTISLNVDTPEGFWSVDTMRDYLKKK